MNPASSTPESVAILAPLGRDAEVLTQLLGHDGMATIPCADLRALLPALQRSGLAIVTEEALRAADITGLAAGIAAQPEWSDFPFILLTLKGGGPEKNPAALRHMQALGNVTFLERPFHAMTLVSLARTALSSRRRQYQARERILALEASEAAIARSDERLKFTLEAGQLGAWEIDFPDRTLRASALCKSNLGLAPDAPLTYEGLLDLVETEDRGRLESRAQVAIDTRTDYEVDCRITQDDGESRWVEIRGRAIYDGDRPTGMVGVSLDITQRKQTEARQQLLIRELHHRVKNTLSTVQAIVGSTARGATSIEAFYRDFTGRIISLANTHNILTEELWQRASLHELLGKELDLYDSGKERVRVSGPAIELPSDYAVPLGMAFHELTTNAAKYGALSNGAGRVSVGWAFVPGSERPRQVRLDWVEEDGPAVTAPTRQGFGTRLLQRVLTAQMKAAVAIDYEPGGLKVSVTFPLPEQEAAATTRGWS